MRSIVMLLASSAIWAAGVACRDNAPPPVAPGFTAPSALAQAAASSDRGVTMWQGSGLPTAAPSVAAAPLDSSRGLPNTPPPPTQADGVTLDSTVSGLGNAQILGAALQIGDELGRLAQRGASQTMDRHVRIFAHDVATVSASTKSELEARADTTGVHPEPSPLSDQVREHASRGQEQLGDASQEGFDRRFVVELVRELSDDLDVLGALASHTSTAPLRAELQRVHARAEGLLHEAKELRDRMGLAAEPSSRP
jgi:predicted outer membrane protein